MKDKPHMFATIAVGLVVVSLLSFGLHLLLLPKIFLIARPLLGWEALSSIGMAVILAWFRHWAAKGLIWLFLELHRLISALIMASVVASEGFMHIFNIPHMEGWWLPLLGGGVATALTAWAHKWRRKLHGK